LYGDAAGDSEFFLDKTVFFLLIMKSYNSDRRLLRVLKTGDYGPVSMTHVSGVMTSYKVDNRLR